MHLIPTEYKSEEKNQSVLQKKKMFSFSVRHNELVNIKSQFCVTAVSFDSSELYSLSYFFFVSKSINTSFQEKTFNHSC